MVSNLKFSVAPMMKVTDRHFRAFVRLLSARTMLYTDMKVSDAVVRGDRARLLEFDECERPLALQLAGSEPARLALCARIAGDAGYDEVNLNVGCPSARVRDGKFGACLMGEPDLVARCVSAMAGSGLPVTVKTRIGIDHHDSYDYLAAFVDRVASGGCEHFIIHARKAWLRGLSPKENRTAPALHYERVYRLKKDFPHLRFTINGGIKTLRDALLHLRYVDGVMVGREAVRDPWMLRAVDAVIFNHTPAAATRADIARKYLRYVERQLARGVRLRHLVRPLFGLFCGQPGARNWRRHLSEHAAKPTAGVEVIQQALKRVAVTGDDTVTVPKAERERILCPAF